MEAAIDSLKSTGHNISDGDIQKLSPLGYEHINIMGRYSFNLPAEIKNGNLRELLSLDDEH
jgi:hypothetical protein